MRSYTRGVKLAVLMPVKAFTEAKQRLADVLSGNDRQRLARWMAEGVVRAAGTTPVRVVCDSEVVSDWARSVGAEPLWTAELGLNGAVDDGVAQLTVAGYDHIIVAHADLPFPRSLLDVARPDTATFVPDARRDGTNVMAFPSARPIPAQYGPGSFARHWASAAGTLRELRPDPMLAIDVDDPTDLAHPLLRPLINEVLPTWLPTTPANHFIRPAT